MSGIRDCLLMIIVRMVPLWLCQNSYGKSQFSMGQSIISMVIFQFAMFTISGMEGRAAGHEHIYEFICQAKGLFITLWL